MGSSGKKAALICGAAMLAIAVPTTALAQQRTFNLPAQPATKSIPEFARQAGIQIVAPGSKLRKIRTRAIAGQQDVRAALALLLEGTGLQVVADDGRTVTLGMASSSGNHRPAAGEARAKAGNGSAAVVGQPTAAREAVAGSAAAYDESAEDIVVTGTNIKGGQNRTAPITTYDRKDIDRAGFVSTQQLIASIPQNFRGGAAGASEDGILGPGTGAGLNTSGATGVNLRGLGNSSTLVLLNGRRIAPASFGTAVDISLIPIAAIDRVDILTDGASAIYGADAVAGVVNFVLRTDFDGQEVRARYGFGAKGAPQLVTLNGTIGRNWQSGNALVSIQYEDRGALPARKRSLTSGALDPTDLFPHTENYSALFSGRQELIGNLEIFGTASLVKKDVERRLTTATRASRDTSRVERYDLTGGIDYHVATDWSINLTGAYSSQHDVSRMYGLPLPPGYQQGAPLRDNDFRIVSVDALVSGTLFELPGGKLRVAFGGSHRVEKFNTELVFAAFGSRFSRKVTAEFAEAYIPIVGETMNVPFVRRIELSAAVRHDDYSDFGSSTNPRFGIAWEPARDLRLRAAYSTSFRPPNATEGLTSQGDNYIVSSFDFDTPAGVAPTFYRAGSDPDLGPEKSRNFTAGIEYNPAWATGLNLRVDYYNIKYRDRIINPPFDSAALLNPSIYGALITRFANDQEAQAFLDNNLAQGFFFFDDAGSGASGVRYAFDLRQQNASEVKIRGLDLALSYKWSSGLSAFAVRGSTSLIDYIRTTFSKGAEPANLVNLYGTPLRHRTRADFSWSRPQLSLNLGVNYAGAYRDTSVSPERRLDSWVTADMAFRYEPRQLKGFSAGVQVSNLFNDFPPRTGAGGAIRYDVANGDPTGRFISFEIRQRW